MNIIDFPSTRHYSINVLESIPQCLSTKCPNEHVYPYTDISIDFIQTSYTLNECSQCPPFQAPSRSAVPPILPSPLQYIRITFSTLTAHKTLRLLCFPLSVKGSRKPGNRISCSQPKNISPVRSKEFEIFTIGIKCVYSCIPGTDSTMYSSKLIVSLPIHNYIIMSILSSVWHNQWLLDRLWKTLIIISLSMWTSMFVSIIVMREY